MTLPVNSSLGSNNIFARYWNAYGGASSFFISYTFWLAIALTYFLKTAWLFDPCLKISPPPWWESALSILPNLLGFSLGGYLMWLGVGSASFRSWLHRSSNDGSPTVYMNVSATFLHFVCAQIIALMLAFIGKHFQGLPDSYVVAVMQSIGATDSVFHEWISPIGNCIGFFFFVYAMLATFDTAFGVFRISSWQDLHARKFPERDKAVSANWIGRKK